MLIFRVPLRGFRVIVSRLRASKQTFGSGTSVNIVFSSRLHIRILYGFCLQGFQKCFIASSSVSKGLIRVSQLRLRHQPPMQLVQRLSVLREDTLRPRIRSIQRSEQPMVVFRYGAVRNYVECKTISAAKPLCHSYST